MRTIMKAGLAVVIGAGAMTAGSSSPGKAQGFYLYGPGIYVEVYPRHRYRHRYHHYYEEPAYYYRDPKVHYPSRRCPPGYHWLPAYGRCSSNFR